MSILEELRTTDRPVIIFGAGVTGRKIYYELKRGMAVNLDKHIQYCDNYKQGEEPVTGGNIITPTELAVSFANAIVCVCIQSLVYRQEVVSQLAKLGFPSERILEYQQLADAIIAEHGGHLKWTDVEGSYDWTTNHRRIAAMAQWLDENDHSVIDFGAGDCYLKQCLRPGVTYIPTDYVARTPEHIKYDFNVDPFPNLHADVSFLAFMLYLAEDWKTLLGNVCRISSNKVVIGIGIKNRNSKLAQLGGGTFYFHSDEEIVETALENGFTLKEEYFDKMGDGQHYNDIWMLFVRTKPNK